MKRCIEWGGLVLVALVTTAPPSFADSPCKNAPAAPTAQTARTRISNEAILGGGSCRDGAVVAIGVDGGSAELNGSNGSRTLAVKATNGDSGVLLRPSAGTWDLRDDLQIAVKVHNTGSERATVSGRAESKAGNTPWSSAVEVAAGASATVAIPFQAQAIELGNGGVTPQYASDLTTGIALRVGGSGTRSIVVDEVRADAPAPAPLPDWLGKRPPVPGQWKMTLDENFEGNSLDASRWSTTGTNYWDKASHFSKQNVSIAHGLATLRFEHRKGHANDDPAQAQTDYATGFLTSMGKWTQRYGYFEARMKMPKAPGLWPAFWLMPDRGTTVADQKERLTTSDGGMEFDIFEYLTRFGPGRYNVALHWDGYGDQHKSASSDGIYVQPDAEGFVVAGLLWEPGVATFYANGKEVARRSDSRIGSAPAYILFTLISGGWGGNELTGAALPDDEYIDWVRAWQRTGR